MSRNEHNRQSKRFRTLCAACQERKARFKYRRQVRADRDHTLCFECHRAEVNRARAHRLEEATRSQRVPSSVSISPRVDAPYRERLTAIG